jgi:hypothetical protein
MREGESAAAPSHRWIFWPHGTAVILQAQNAPCMPTSELQPHYSVSVTRQRMPIIVNPKQIW